MIFTFIELNLASIHLVPIVSKVVCYELSGSQI